ncbi:type II secretion system protein [Aliivibrio sp. S4TY2]|uniref:pilin n=1 Tax=unclassified Aliivibrio TaxID=2645654 RepID=UPI002378DA67|nr:MULTISPECIES: type II secretion system protein [unclassified Aliivibrio]MDD9155398.1 type II secretion system protein [Aliivibrio sp. S4TY2]MDD9161525.1 type II secretion system protein [Aliivibrio sp. S4TY1]MDD9165555.1 type II secretion system protein [Aliivibrio sp. S4MY2]MDD9169554.1 type II secretion system protein [Aliivibrio sp. S4MY4]MDD9186547.1 type II secretion system protein [Aliivibrio sp. S4MY3]
MKKKTFGFTLIELIVGIVLIAILTIIAVPKFLNYSYNAYVSQAEGIAANFEQSVIFTQYRWITSGNLIAKTDLEGFASEDLDVNTLGFPLGIKKNRVMAQPKNIGKGKQGCNDLWNALLIDPPTVSHRQRDETDFLSVRYRSEGQSFQDSCYYINRLYGFNSSNPEESQIKISYNSSKGTVVVITQK